MNGDYHYGFNSLVTRKSLWNILVNNEQGVNKPWILGGDFTAVLHPSDKLGAPIIATELKEFSECFQSLHLNELAWKGDYHTWSNKQIGTDRICSR